GMSKQEVLERCSKAGYRVLDASKDDLTVLDREHPTEQSRLFRVIVKNGRVTFAQRGWYHNDEPFTSILGALKSLGETRRGCSVVHRSESAPDEESDKVWITCGPRTVQIMTANVNGSTVADVQEQIGQ